MHTKMYREDIKLMYFNRKLNGRFISSPKRDTLAIIGISWGCSSKRFHLAYNRNDVSNYFIWRCCWNAGRAWDWWGKQVHHRLLSSPYPLLHKHNSFSPNNARAQAHTDAKTIHSYRYRLMTDIKALGNVHLRKMPKSPGTWVIGPATTVYVNITGLEIICENAVLLSWNVRALTRRLLRANGSNSSPDAATGWEYQDSRERRWRNDDTIKCRKLVLTLTLTSTLKN